MNEPEKICPHCHWYKTDRVYSDKIHCINLDRKDWKGIEPKNTCDDFVLLGEYEPTGIWALLTGVVQEIDNEIKKQSE